MKRLRISFEKIILGIQFNDEQYNQKLKRNCNFDKKQRSETFFVNKNQIFGLHMQEAIF